jgi:uncharacterized protein (DUF58 family)
MEGYAVVAAVGFVAGLALRRPELATAASAFALVLAVGTWLARDPSVSISLMLETDRTLEETDVGAEIAIHSETPVDRLEILLDVPEAVVVAPANAIAVRLAAGEERAITLRLRCSRWGAFDVGEIEIRARDALRLVVWQQRIPPAHRLRIYPKPETVRRLFTPIEPLPSTGSEVARQKGDGIEYADIRDYVPGDRLRSINWRASARRNALVVNEQHPERNADIVLFVDSFTDLRGRDHGTLDDAVRAAATLATRYLARRDRVGLVSFGGLLRWLRPGMGVVQLFRLIETLLETDVQPTYTWRNLGVIPARILPSKALVVALSPLVDPRFVVALEDLRARGYDLAVVEIDPIDSVEAGRSAVEMLAYRLWLLEREALRSRLERLGIAVGRWGNDQALEKALEEMRTYRRYARLERV